MKIEWDCVRGLCLLLVPGLIVLVAILAAGRGEAAGDRFVAMLEARQGLAPGATRVIPDCGCTIRYVGTVVHGHRYNVIIDRLD